MPNSKTVPNNSFGSKQMNNTRLSSSKKSKEQEQEHKPEPETKNEMNIRERVKKLNKELGRASSLKRFDW